MPRITQMMRCSFAASGVRVDAIQIPDVIRQMEAWIAAGPGCHSIAFVNLHGISEANRDPEFKTVLNCTDLVVPDGMPLVWLGRLRGHPMGRRVYGPEVMEDFCRKTGSRYRHFFYGGADGVAERLATGLKKRFGTIVAGACSPPFRGLTQEEDEALVQKVHSAAPDVLWVGLGAPKQERWMQKHHARLRVPVMLGVGAAFDFNCGRVRQAPEWMRESGLEWLFRLCMEPRRLWKRYLVKVPSAIWSLSLEIAHLRKFD